MRAWNNLLRKFVFVIIIFLVSVLSAISVVLAATTDTISFQSKIVNSDGTNVVDDTYNFKFLIYDASTGGNLLWSEEKSIVVTDGVLSTNLGDLSSFDPDIFNNSDLYLQICFDANGVDLDSSDVNCSAGTHKYEEVFSIRKSITSVPVALRAKGLIDNSVLSGDYFAQGGNFFGEAAVLGTKDDNSLQFIANSSTVMTIFSGGNVGIGSISAESLLTLGDYDSAGILFSRGLFSSGNVLLSNLEGGAYFGSNKISTNSFALNDLGQNWTQCGYIRNWRGLAISSDGKYQTIGANGSYIYVSSDYGGTWSEKDGVRNWYGIAMSADGKIQTATVNNGQVYVSSDYGNTWTAKESSRNWYSVAMSSDGRIQTANVSGGQIYTSADYGNTWTARDSSRNWMGLDMSSDGKIQTASVAGGSLFVSRDYGETWTLESSSTQWRHLAMSDDGKIQLVAAINNDLYISTDYGDTWNGLSLGALGWIDVSMSSDGRVMAGTVYNGQIYISEDYGATWNAQGPTNTWYRVKMSADGHYITAAANAEFLYTSSADVKLAEGGLVLGGTLNFLDSDSSHQTIFTTGDQLSDITYVLPTVAGSDGQVLGTDASGNLSWVDGSGGVLYSATDAALADGTSLTLNHAQNTNDVLANAWIYKNSTWQQLDASYSPAIQWEGKDTQKGFYHDSLNTYASTNEFFVGMKSTISEGLLFDTFEDGTKMDSSATTILNAYNIGDDGSTNFITLSDRIQAGRIGLWGGQTLTTSTTDNSGNTYLGSNNVNDIFYYDRGEIDSIPAVQIELGVDPNWYNGVTLTSARSSGLDAKANANLTERYNGSLIKASGRYSANARPILITIKTSTTFDWTDNNGNSGTGVTITPGVAQVLGSTGVSATFTDVEYNVGDVFQIASWYTEPESVAGGRGDKQQFPERANIISTDTSVDIVDADTQKLWMRFQQGANYAMQSDDSDPSAVSLINGIIYVSVKDGVGATGAGLHKLNFVRDMVSSMNHVANYIPTNPSIASRNTAIFASYNTDTSVVLVDHTANDVSAAVIPNAPTQEITVSGWGYIEGDNTTYIEEDVALPFKFNAPPIISISSGGTSGTNIPQSPSDCNAINSAYNQVATGVGVTETTFLAQMYRDAGLSFGSGYYHCYTWTATGTVSPKQFVAASTEGGVTVINETENFSYDVYYNSANMASSTLFLTTQGDLYYSRQSGGGTTYPKLAVLNGVHGIYSDKTALPSRDYIYQWGTGPFVTRADTDTIYDVYVTEGTSTMDNGNGNTVYVGTNNGAVVIQEYKMTANTDDKDDEMRLNSMKLYSRYFVSEELVGDIRASWGFSRGTDFQALGDLTDYSFNQFELPIFTVGGGSGGVRNGYAGFNGSDYLDCSDATCGGTDKLDMGDSDFSYGAWIRTSGNTVTQHVIRKGEWAGDPAYQIAIDPTTGYVRANIYDGTNQCDANSSTSVTDSEWHHVIATMDKDFGCSLYLDGELIAQDLDTTIGSLDSPNSFYLGGHNSTGTYAGDMDEPFVTATLISPSKIKQMYEVGKRALNTGYLGTTFAQELAGYSDKVTVIKPDWNNQYMYVGTEDSSNGGLSKIQLNSDTSVEMLFSSNTIPNGGMTLISEEINSLSVGHDLNAIGSLSSGIQLTGTSSTTGNFVSKTYTIDKKFGSAVLWVKPSIDTDDASNVIMVKASNDGGTNYYTCDLKGTDIDPALPELEYSCEFPTVDTDLKVKFEFARGSTKTSTYITEYGVTWLGEGGFRLEQTDANNVNLYNFTGESQNVKLGVSAGGTGETVSLVWSDEGDYLKAVNNEGVRIYDATGSDYLSLVHDGTNINFGQDGAVRFSLDASGNLLPGVSDTYDLGSSTSRWQDLYLGPNSLHVGVDGNEGILSYDTGASQFNLDKDIVITGDVWAQSLGYVFTTLNTDSTLKDNYTKFATITLPARYQDYNAIIEIVSHHSSETEINSARLQVRVKQNASFGNNPDIDFKVTESNGIPASWFVYEIVSNAGPTVVDLYAKPGTDYTKLSGSVIFNDDSEYIEWWSNGGYVSAVTGSIEATMGIYQDADTNFIGLGGIDNPTYPLEVGYGSGEIRLDPGTVESRLWLDTSASGYAGILATESNGGTALRFWTSTTSSGTERVRISDSGDVGIGTSDPQYPLDVNGTINFGPAASTSHPLPNGGNIDSIAIVGTASTSKYIMTLQDGSGRVNTYWNAFRNSSTGNFEYIEGGEGATRQLTNGGTWDLYVAGDGVNSGDTISWIQAIDVASTGVVTFPQGHNDLAENYIVNGTVVSGTLVSIDQADEKNLIAASDVNSDLVGVVSTAPGAVMDDEGGLSMGYDVKPSYTDEKAPVALAGTAPVIVIIESGDTIGVGDTIGISDSPGVGQKSSVGYTIGRALESLDYTSVSCGSINSVVEVVWPEDDGKNTLRPCFDLPDGRRIGKIMVAIQPMYIGGASVSADSFWTEVSPGTIQTVNDIIASGITGTTASFSVLDSMTLNINDNFLVDDSGNAIAASLSTPSIKGIGTGINMDILSSEVFTLTSEGQELINASVQGVKISNLKVNDKQAGKSTITAGDTSIIVTTDYVSMSSVVVVTPSKPILYGVEILTDGEFVITIPSTQVSDVEFSWVVLNN